jgi:PAS domain S-box-containing protein
VPDPSAEPIAARVPGDERLHHAAPGDLTIHAINQRIFDTSLDLILVVDRRGTLMRISPSSQGILGYHPDEMVGHSAKEFLYHEDLDSTREEMRQARRGRLTRHFECRYVHRQGRVVTLSWTGVWSEPEQQHFFIGRDITELKETERRLRRSEALERRAAQALARLNADLERQVEQRTAEVIHLQKMESIGHLTGGIAHDFNNLLMAISGNLELLGTRLAADARAHELLQNALAATERGASLTQRMLAFARRQALVPGAVDIAALVRSMAELLNQSLDPTITLQMRFAPALPPAHVDPHQLELALINLCVNARDAMLPDGGTLTLAGEATNLAAGGVEALIPGALIPGEYICLSVTDTGRGMDATTLERAVEPFFTTKEVGKGTGLGLSMVHGLAAQSGGCLVLRSVAGEGTTAELWLQRATAVAIPLEQPPVDTVTGCRALSVLVVDDDPLVLESARAMLEELGHSVEVASSGQDALIRLQDRRALDVVLTDYGMPGMSGLQLAHDLRQLRPGLPVLIMTGFAEVPVEVGREVPCLRKPFRLSELSTVLSALPP